jgi:MFS transporter, AAHS family, 4-hydroxybenzoate transporter
LNSVVGLIYPTAIRANGTGWALGIGRFGAILGPLVGGQLIGAHLPLRLLFFVPVVPLAIGAVAAILLRPLARERFRRKGTAMPAADDSTAADDGHTVSAGSVQH